MDSVVASADSAFPGWMLHGAAAPKSFHPRYSKHLPDHNPALDVFASIPEHPNHMQIKSAVFNMSARNFSSCPDWNRREFAFIGRSNVGKSSMINMLTNKDALAKVSATPGKTQLLNFFVIN